MPASTRGGHDEFQEYQTTSRSLQNVPEMLGSTTGGHRAAFEKSEWIPRGLQTEIPLLNMFPHRFMKLVDYLDE